MTCVECGEPTSRRVATSQSPYLYELTGLSGIRLVGIEIFKCEACNHEFPIIPRMPALHRLIAKNVAMSPHLLKGEEIRFLRKHAGFPANKFAMLLGITPEYLCRVEKGENSQLGEPTDRLARLMAVAASDAEEVRQALMELADSLEQQRGEVAPVFRLNNGNKWVLAEAA